MNIETIAKPTLAEDGQESVIINIDSHQGYAFAVVIPLEEAYKLRNQINTAIEYHRPTCKCGNNPCDELHTCPYVADINNDTEYLCSCCKDCTDDCAQDI